MPKALPSLTLQGHDKEHVTLSSISHQGNGAYLSQITVQSNGFSCNTPFTFDNDEYFLAKLKELQTKRNTDAELLDLQSDNYLRIVPINPDTIMVSGLILDKPPFAQMLEFAFATDYQQLAPFVSAFDRMLQANA